jgi:hypothetical protein
MDKLPSPLPKKRLQRKKSIAPYIYYGDLSSAQQNRRDKIAKTQKKRREQAH